MRELEWHALADLHILPQPLVRFLVVVLQLLPILVRLASTGHSTGHTSRQRWVVEEARLNARSYVVVWHVVVAYGQHSVDPDAAFYFRPCCVNIPVSIEQKHVATLQQLDFTLAIDVRTTLRVVEHDVDSLPELLVNGAQDGLHSLFVPIQVQLLYSTDRSS